MRTMAITLVALGLALAAAPAVAQNVGPGTTFTLLSAQQGGNFVWVTEDGAANPTLVVPASTEITITIRKGTDTAGVPHNIQVGQNEASGDIMNEGDEETYTFTSPASGTLDYVCVYHPTTMKGTLAVEGSEGDGNGAGGNGSPGLGVLGAGLALLGAALLAARRK